jgi:hypothetical protein
MKKIAIYQFTDGSESWAVERCDPDDDGICEMAVFSGPNAERQAKEFARVEYGVSEPARQHA